MIVDRYPPRRLLRLAPDLPQAFEPELAQLDRLLEDDAIFGRIKADMARRRPHSFRLGRPGTPVEVVLRLLVLKRLHGWSYEQVERFVGGSLVLRQFCRVYLKRVPDGTRHCCAGPRSSRPQPWPRSTSAWSCWHVGSR